MIPKKSTNPKKFGEIDFVRSPMLEDRVTKSDITPANLFPLSFGQETITHISDEDATKDEIKNVMESPRKGGK